MPDKEPAPGWWSVGWATGRWHRAKRQAVTATMRRARVAFIAAAIAHDGAPEWLIRASYVTLATSGPRSPNRRYGETFSEAEVTLRDYWVERL
jgi:hypothetical protein